MTHRRKRGRHTVAPQKEKIRLRLRAVSPPEQKTRFGRLPKRQKTHFFTSGNLPKAKLAKNSIRALAQRLTFGLFRLRLSAQKPNLDYSDFGTLPKGKKTHFPVSGNLPKAKRQDFHFCDNKSFSGHGGCDLVEYRKSRCGSLPLPFSFIFFWRIP